MTGSDIELLDFEHHHPSPSGSKDVQIRELFALSPTTYHQRLMVLIDDPSALAYNPQLVNRLRRLREQRRTARAR